jgi:hypothetical protein
MSFAGFSKRRKVNQLSIQKVFFKFLYMIAAFPGKGSKRSRQSMTAAIERDIRIYSSRKTN